MIFEEKTVDHERYISVLTVAFKLGNDMFGNIWMFQQDGGAPNIHHKTQNWCQIHLPSFTDKERWPPNSSDLNPLDYGYLE